jgi:hypothetical protein
VCVVGVTLYHSSVTFRNKEINSMATIVAIRKTQQKFRVNGFELEQQQQQQHY